MAARFSDPGQPYEGLARRKLTIVNNEERDPGNKREARWTGEVRFIAEHLADPLRWRKPQRVFVNSMSDLFHERLSNEEIAAVFGVMAAAPQHTFQVLTKRAKRMREWFEWFQSEVVAEMDPDDTMAQGRVFQLCACIDSIFDDKTPTPLVDALDEMRFDINRAPLQWPLPNVWLGVSVENQDAADERIPELLRTPAVVRFLSCEPLIGPVDLRGCECGNMWCGGERLRSYRFEKQHDDGRIEVLEERKERIAWVIAGCESGPGARPCNVEWLRSLRDQCAAAGAPYFLKQAVGTVHDSHETRSLGAVEADTGSRRKAGNVIELPYLDGVQHKDFPNVDR